ncbi:unnamed protein product [Paramecium sonneborni]|uniref:Uncharacterized protein n=1 Tax=Paramecium sonneborni TaxID=65129 RepID=A0A8S1RE74_9CILI|nr:unnamed protein product [Paramecium sonneborni]
MFRIITSFLVLTQVTTQQVVLHSSSFTDKKFTSLEDWTIYPENPLKIGYGSVSIDDEDYAGLRSVVGRRVRLGGLDAIFKTFDNIQPHSSLIIKGKILMFNFGQGGTAVAEIKADGASILLIDGTFIQTDIQKQFSFEANFQHSTSSVLITFNTYANRDFERLTIGFREFELYYRKCPEGCAYCQIQDKSPSDCNFWIMDHSSLSDNNQLNDGWSINSNQYSMDYCQNDKKLNLFGFAKSKESIEKTFFLQPHYKILIQFKHILLGADFSALTFWNLELDGTIVMEITYLTYLLNTQICSFHNPASYGDNIREIKYSRSHQNTTMKIRLFAAGTSTLKVSRWSIRNFNIFIQKCHPDCEESCNGPKNTQCSKVQYQKYNEFINYFTEPLFTDIIKWQIINPIMPKTPNICGGISLFGGYLQLDGKHYIQRLVALNVHKTLQIQFKFYQIDIFNNDILYVVVDDQIIYQTTLEPVFDKSKANPMCGIFDDFEIVLKISTPVFQHTKKQSIIQIYTNQPISSSGYWGIRDFILLQDSKTFISEFREARFQISDWLNFQWKITEKLSLIGTCKNLNYIGGDNGLSQNSKLRNLIENLPLHSKIRIQFTLIIKYTTITNDFIQFIYSVDDNPLYTKKNIKLIADQYCETSLQNSKAFTFDEVFSHNDNSLLLFMWMENLTNDSFWGIRDFYLSYSEL